MSEYLEGGGGAASDSEAEDEASRVAGLAVEVPARWISLFPMVFFLGGSSGPLRGPGQC